MTVATGAFEVVSALRRSATTGYIEMVGGGEVPGTEFLSKTEGHRVVYKLLYDQVVNATTSRELIADIDKLRNLPER
jgi:hypothetical protein